jgi:hypothetical protein
VTLFTKKHTGDIFICQVYVDDIIFGSTNDCHCKELGELMSIMPKISFRIKKISSETQIRVVPKE